jgi:hypothetical protein
MTGNLLFSWLRVSFTKSVVFAAGMDVTTTSTTPRQPRVTDAPLPQLLRPLRNRYVTPAVYLTWSSERYIVTFIVTHSGHVTVHL